MQGQQVVKSRLKVLIAERNLERARQGQEPLTVRGVALAAGLAPSVVGGLTSNRSQRIDFATIDKLCRFFSCQPGELLEYTPEGVAA